MLLASAAALYAPFAPRPVGDVRPVVLLHLCGAGQPWVAGFIEGLDVVLALNLNHTFCHNVFKWSQEASPTAVYGARCTVVCWSYGSLAGNR